MSANQIASGILKTPRRTLAGKVFRSKCGPAPCPSPHGKNLQKNISSTRGAGGRGEIIPEGRGMQSF